MPRMPWNITVLKTIINFFDLVANPIFNKTVLRPKEQDSYNIYIFTSNTYARVETQQYKKEPLVKT